jgi:hypothetical protein
MKTRKLVTTEGEEFIPHWCTLHFQDDEIERNLFYRVYLTGPKGARFVLLREKHHTDEDVMIAKGWLRANHDVVQIEIVKEAKNGKS